MNQKWDKYDVGIKSLIFISKYAEMIQKWVKCKAQEAEGDRNGIFGSNTGITG